MTGEWCVRPYRAGDERELVGLFERVFGRALTPEQWCWKLQPSQSAVDNVWLAVHDEKPIFQYAGIATRFQVGDAVRTVMVSVDTMTAPEFQRRGLLSEVGRTTYAHWRDGDIAFVLGLPNERWGSRARVLGWVELFPLQWLTRALRPARLLARRLHLPTVAGFDALDGLWNGLADRALAVNGQPVCVRVLTQAEAALDRLWATCRDEYGFSVVRDRAWLHWRYFTPPSLRYTVLLAERAGEPAGYLAFRVSDGAGLIAELFTRTDDTAARNALIGQALAAMRLAGAVSASILAVPGTCLQQAVRRAGFLPRDAFTVQMVPLDSRLPLDQLRDPRQWGIAGGDFDVV